MMHIYIAILGLFLFLIPVTIRAQSSVVNSNSFESEVIELTLPALLNSSNAFQIQNVLSGYEEKILSVMPDYTTSRVRVTYLPQNILPEDIMQILFVAGYNSWYKDDDGRVFEMKDAPQLKTRYQKIN